MKHHFVPQFLLRRWAGADGKVHVLQIRHGRLVSRARSPEYTGYEDDLYALSGDNARVAKHHFEQTLFAPIDDKAAIALAKIENRQTLSEEEHRAWTVFLCSLRVRRPDTIDFLRTEMVEHFRRGLTERDANTLPEGWPSTEAWIGRNLPGFVANFGLTLLRQMIEHPEVMETFGALNWWCQEFGADDPPLLLADFPLHTEEKLADPDFVMMMPIAPDRAFFGTRSANTKHRLASLDLAELAQRLNKASIASAAERMWARDEAPAREIIEANLSSMGVNTFEFRTLAPWIGQQTRTRLASRLAKVRADGRTNTSTAMSSVDPPLVKAGASSSRCWRFG